MSDRCTSNMPSNEYAISSSCVVWRPRTHASRSATVKSDKNVPRSAFAGMPVISRINGFNVHLFPKQDFFRIKIDFLRGHQLLQRPFTGKPLTLSERILPSSYNPLLTKNCSARNIGQTNVASFCVAIPSEHAIDRSLKLDTVRLVDAAGVNTKVPQTVSFRLYYAKLDLFKTLFALPITWRLRKIGEDYLVEAPGMGKDCIRGTSSGKRLGVRL
jgi:hypothetical protein